MVGLLSQDSCRQMEETRSSRVPVIVMRQRTHRGIPPLEARAAGGRAGLLRTRSPVTLPALDAQCTIPKGYTARSHHPRAVEHRDCPPCRGGALLSHGGERWRMEGYIRPTADCAGCSATCSFWPAPSPKLLAGFCGIWMELDRPVMCRSDPHLSSPLQGEEPSCAYLPIIEARRRYKVPPPARGRTGGGRVDGVKPVGVALVLRRTRSVAALLRMSALGRAALEERRCIFDAPYGVGALPVAQTKTAALGAPPFPLVSEPQDLFLMFCSFATSRSSWSKTMGAAPAGAAA